MNVINGIPKDSQFLYDFFEKESPWIEVLLPLLHTLNWHGSKRKLIESLPYLYKKLDFDGFLKIMRLLGFESNQFRSRLNKLDERIAPCVFFSKKSKKILILKEKKIDGWLCFDAYQKKEIIQDLTNDEGVVCFFNQKNEKEKDLSSSWLRNVIRQFKPLLTLVLIISFILNGLMLATPVFVMSVYDKVISSHSISMLLSFIGGVAIAFLGWYALQLLRSKILADIGANLDTKIGNAIIKRLLYLPASFTESSSISAQLSRIKDFDTTRDFFTGPLLVLVFDFPFALFFILIIAVISGYLALIPIIAIIIFLMVCILIHKPIARLTQKNVETAAVYYQFLLETINYLRIIRYSGVESVWLQRFKTICAERIFCQYKMSMWDGALLAFSDAMMILSGLFILSFGAYLVINVELSMGALIATMILVWRTLIPIKSLFLTLLKLDNVKQSMAQINKLMNLPLEKDPKKQTQSTLKLKGKISLQNINMRYPEQFSSSLSGITFSIPYGKVLAITGKNGSGKSTLLKILLGLYSFQSGNISFDDKTIFQIDLTTLRHKIAYSPQKTSLFYGTIEQNLKLSNPLATKEQMWHALTLAGLKEELLALPLGLQTQIRDQYQFTITLSFQKRLNIARALVKKTPILLIDEVCDGIDKKSDLAFRELVKTLKGKKTIIFISHRPSHLQLADQVLVLDDGQIVGGGPSEKVVNQLLERLKNEKNAY